MTRTLYHLPLSPFCRKIRLQMAEKQLGVELIEEAVWEGRAAFFALNPAGDVPVLQEENGQVYCGGYAISEYLEEAYKLPNLIGESIAERSEIRRLVQWFDEKFYDEVSRPILFEKVYRRLMQCGSPDTDLIRVAKESLLYHYEYMVELLAERTWLAGEFFTLADIAAASHISALDFLGDISWNQAQGIKEWYALVKSRSSFRSLLLDRVRGFHPPSYYGNPDF
ncbi:MAG: glutathione S-transferase family protein [Rickettsiales bacterium]|nr:glutathione S-transferase family protein [Rickettsiales bacterium]